MMTNRYVVAGAILMMAGIVLTPLLVGLPIALFGWLLGIFGVAVYWIGKIPGGKQWMKYLGEYVVKILNIFKEIFKEAWKK